MKRSGTALCFTLGAIAVLAGILGCRNDMWDQPSLQSHESTWTPPPGSLAITALEGPVDSEEVYNGLLNPVPSDDSSREAGRRLFLIYCSPCHGPEGAGGGAMAEHLGEPDDLGDPAYLDRPDGYFYAMIRHGTGRTMESYGESLNPDERWHIVNYLRFLQRR